MLVELQCDIVVIIMRQVFVRQYLQKIEIISFIILCFCRNKMYVNTEIIRCCSGDCRDVAIEHVVLTKNNQY